MDTIENNKLIAEFIGQPYTENIREYEIQRCLNHGVTVDMPKHIDTLMYHTSWDWLMPVVDKIEEITMSNYESFNVVQQNDKCFIESNHNGDFISFDGDKKQATYKAVVEFIKWYNENKIN